MWNSPATCNATHLQPQQTTLQWKVYLACSEKKHKLERRCNVKNTKGPNTMRKYRQTCRESRVSPRFTKKTWNDIVPSVFSCRLLSFVLLICRYIYLQRSYTVSCVFLWTALQISSTAFGVRSSGFYAVKGNWKKGELQLWRHNPKLPKIQLLNKVQPNQEQQEDGSERLNRWCDRDGAKTLKSRRK